MPSKVAVQIATPNKSRKVFSQDHITTHSFMRPRPIFCREYVPKRNMSVNVDSFLRANPMPVPIFGHAKVHNRAFFVPFRTVMRDWNEFYTSAPYSYPNAEVSIPSSVPLIPNNELVTMFIGNVGGQWVTEVIAGDHDITVKRGNNSSYYAFTVAGINLLSVIEGLGYKINWNTGDTYQMSALPLMCYAKVLVDWYYPSAYVGDASYVFVQSIFNNPIDGHVLDQTEISGLLTVAQRCCYQPDYFVNAWDSPVGPNSVDFERKLYSPDVTNDSAYAQIVSNDPSGVSSPYGPGTKPTNGTPFVGGQSTGQAAASGVLTQYVLDALKALTDYTKRHQLSGVRALDRYLAELGISLSSEIMDRSMYLGSQSFDMEFYDVFSHANTVGIGGAGDNGSPLGAYAGKGNGYSGSKTFDFEDGQEFGMFIIVNSIIPQIGYYQGQHRETMHTNCLDFYHGDFDHMAVQPISQREVYVSQDGDVAVAQPALNTGIFGYAPKYIEYNTPQDLQTGLYRIRTRNALLPCYTLMRDLSFYEQGLLSAMKHNYGFVIGNDAAQYNRITFGTKDGEDIFNAIHHFDVTYVDSTLPAYDTYDFDEQNGEIMMDVNGSKLN